MQDTERPINRARSEPGPPSQYQDGIHTAAYQGTENQNRKTKLHAIVESDTDGDLSPSPQPSLTSRSLHRADKYLFNAQRIRKHRDQPQPTMPASPGNRSNASAARSDEPQEDPSMEAFPAIRGERLEKEFFDSPGRVHPSQNPAQQQRQQHQTKTDRPVQRRAPVIEAEAKHDVDADSAGTETDKAAKLESALKYGSERLPAATHIMDVLKELEEDFNHYLG